VPKGQIFQIPNLEIHKDDVNVSFEGLCNLFVGFEVTSDKRGEPTGLEIICLTKM
jgi:hypothetical protein